MKMTAEKKAIDKVFRRRDRYDIPDWQRQEVWSREKKQRLIDSMLRGWNFPSFTLSKSPGTTSSSKTANSDSPQSGNSSPMISP
jgi:uncharacterized protein with ParB-like and HNH nuclease domain